MTTLYRACQEVRIEGWGEYPSGMDMLRRVDIDETVVECSSEMNSEVASKTELGRIISGVCPTSILPHINDCSVEKIGDITVTTREQKSLMEQIADFFKSIF